MVLLISPSKRYQICKSCPYSRKSRVLGVKLLTCGEFKKGGTVIHEGREIRLCGCIMRIKDTIPFMSCPAKKW